MNKTNDNLNLKITNDLFIVGRDARQGPNAGKGQGSNGENSHFKLWNFPFTCFTIYVSFKVVYRKKSIDFKHAYVYITLKTTVLDF
jgi:hypothetical protein